MGLRELVKTKTFSEKSECDRRRPNMIVIWVIIAAVAILGLGGFMPENKKEDEQTEQAGNELYEKEQEERLSKILKKINGAGDVTVYIRLEDGGEAVTAKNQKSASEEEDGGHREESETSVVMGDKGAEPYVTKIKEPQIAGVLVVASGAANEYVRVKIYEAVKALYGVSPHRIQVTY